mgnify:CR=1 FL=1|jgi:hypothetical protein
MGSELLDLKDCYQSKIPAGYRRLAWEGVSLCVPSNWEIADYRYLRRQACRIEIEDEVAIRLEAEWVRATGRLNLESIMERYEKASKPLTVKAEEKEGILGLPQGWHATRFIFKETGAGKGASLKFIRHELVTAFYICPQSSLFCFLLLHFLPEDREDPVEITQRLASSFKDHRDEDYTPWQLFDLSYKMPSKFSLTKASFDIGSKLMIFEWEKRRLFLWTHSCADVFLKGTSPEKWAVGNLNAEKRVRGIIFRNKTGEGMGWRRKKMHPFGSRDDIGRWCFRFHVGCKVMKENNQLLVWVYHYRENNDLLKLPAELAPS